MEDRRERRAVHTNTFAILNLNYHFQLNQTHIAWTNHTLLFWNKANYNKAMYWKRLELEEHWHDLWIIARRKLYEILQITLTTLTNEGRA